MVAGGASLHLDVQVTVCLRGREPRNNIVSDERILFPSEPDKPGGERLDWLV